MDNTPPSTPPSNVRQLAPAAPRRGLRRRRDDDGEQQLPAIRRRLNPRHLPRDGVRRRLDLGPPPPELEDMPGPL